MNIQNPYTAPESIIDSQKSIEGLKIESIRSGQKIIIYGILLHFLAIGLQFAIGPIAGLLVIVTAILGIIGILRMAIGFNYGVVKKILLIISMFIPLIGLLVLLSMNSKSTAALREAGYKVGLLGASKK